MIMAAQVKRAKDELMAEMKSSGVEYEERMERLAQVETPKPNREWTYADFDAFRARHPWVGSDNVQPKSIVREMFERAMTFGEYIGDYGLKRSEGVLLRYMSDVYKGLVQNVARRAPHRRTRRRGRLAGRGGAPGRLEPDRRVGTHAPSRRVGRRVGARAARRGRQWRAVDRRRRAGVPGDGAQPDVRLGAEVWRGGVRTTRSSPTPTDRSLWSSTEAMVEAMAGYWAEFDEIRVDADARSGELFAFDRRSGRVTQILHDPDGANEWRITAAVDLVASAEEGRAVVRLVSLASAL